MSDFPKTSVDDFVEPEIVDLKMTTNGTKHYHPEFPTVEVTFDHPDGRRVHIEIISPGTPNMGILANVACQAATGAWEDLKGRA